MSEMTVRPGADSPPASEKSAFHILIIDDEPLVKDLLNKILRAEGYTVALAENGAAGLRQHQREPVDLIITDMNMPEMCGLELLRQLRENDDPVPVIVITGYSTIEDAVEAMRLGAEDYLTKPFQNIELRKIVNRIYENSRLRASNERLRQAVSSQEIPAMVGESAAMKKVYSLILKVSGSDISVLLTGATGTGKEVAARAIHHMSERRDEPFIAINCAQFPRELLESELFGFERGAFSGAHQRKFGLFEIADKGTLFLDEIGEMPPDLQAKLLRVVETRQFTRLGGVELITVDVRIISATNRDLEKEINGGCFRADLYYRLNTFPIKLPLLRDRDRDLDLLVDNFLHKKGIMDITVSDKVLTALRLYAWPGNVRELENVLERMLLLGSNRALAWDDLPPDIRKAVPFKNDDEQSIPELVTVEKDHILNVYHYCRHDKVRTAKLLGIGLKTLYRKLKTYGV